MASRTMRHVLDKPVEEFIIPLNAAKLFHMLRDPCGGREKSEWLNKLGRCVRVSVCAYLRDAFVTLFVGFKYREIGMPLKCRAISKGRKSFASARWTPSFLYI